MGYLEIQCTVDESGHDNVQKCACLFAVHPYTVCIRPRLAVSFRSRALEAEGMKTYLFLVLLLILIAPTLGAPIIDGSRDAEYGAPIVVQQTQTGFGDANPPGSLGGSELDAAYAK